MKNKTPPCANWRMWVGKEVEGATAIGERTLFVRAGDVLATLAQHPDLRRVWLCKEYLMSHSQASLLPLVRKLLDQMITVVVEIPLTQFSEYTYLRPFVYFYIKIPLSGLYPGDHVCIGAAFQDESFVIGTGNVVTPEMYLQDEQIA